MDILPAIIFRLFAPIPILYFPFWGSLLGTLADSLDVVIWHYMNVENIPVFYNFVDKALDNYMYFIMLVVVLKFKNKIVRKTAIILFIYRIFGSILFEITGFRYLLFIFPNVFVTYFIVYSFIKGYFKKDPIKTHKNNYIFLLLVFIPKLIQEYYFHVVQIGLFAAFLSLVEKLS